MRFLQLMLTFLVATGAKHPAPVAVCELFMIRRVRIMAARTIYQAPCHRVHVRAFPHAVQMGLFDLVMALETKGFKVRVQELWLAAGMGNMAGSASLLGRGMLVFLAHHLLVVAVVAQGRTTPQQHGLGRGRVGGVTIQAFLAGSNRRMPDISAKALLLGVLMALPAEGGNQLAQFLFSLGGMAGRTLSFRIGFMPEGAQERLAPLGAGMGIMAAEAVGCRDINVAVLRPQFGGIMTLQAKGGNGFGQEPPVIGAVRIMAGSALAVGYRLMQGSAGEFLFEVIVAAETEVFARRCQQPFVACGMVGMAGAAVSFRQRFVLEFSAGNVRLVAVAEEAESGAFSHQKLVRRGRVGIMAGDAFSLLHRRMDYGSLDDVFCGMALETEFFLGNEQGDTAWRAARGVAGITTAILERFVHLAFQQFFIRGGMGVMAGSAIGFLAGQVPVRGAELLLGQIVTPGAELAHWLEQHAWIGGSMRIVAGIAFSLLNRGMDRPFLELLLFRLMAGVAKRGAGGAQPLLKVRRMRVVTARALAARRGSMHIRRRKRLGHPAMAGQTQDFLIIAKQGAVVAAMGVVAAAAIFLRRRMRIFFR